MNINSNNVQTEGPQKVGGPEIVWDRLEKEFFALEALFCKQVADKQRGLTEQMEASQSEINILNHLLGAVNIATTENGLDITPELQQKLASIGMLDQDLRLANPHQPDLTPADKEKAIKALAKEASAVEMLNKIGLSFKINYAGHENDFKNLVIELQDEQHANHPLRKLFNDLGIDLNQAPAQDLLDKVALAANKSDAANPAEQTKETDVEKQNRLKDQYDNRQIREMLSKHKLISHEPKLNKRSADQLAHNIRGVLKEKEAFNNLHSRKYSESESLLNKLYEMLTTCAKKYSDAIEKFARNIRGN